MNWRDRRLVLPLLGILLVINLVVFFTYRVQQQNRIESLRERRAELEQELQKAQLARETARQQIASVSRLEKELVRIFDQSWGTPDERLTPLLRELYRHANESGLQPSSRTYGNEQTSREGEATAMTISFGVEGTYEQLREMIQLIETSDQYVVIDSLSLGERENAGLTITIELRTLFREDPKLPRGAQQTAAGSRS